MAKSKKSVGGVKKAAAKKPVAKKAAAKTKPVKSAKKTLAQELKEFPGGVEDELLPLPSKKPTVVPERGLSLLSAAAEILRSSGEPLNVKQIVDKVVAAKLWTPGAGKTPNQTLAAAILKEMGKGEASRFVKVGRGLFAAKG